MPASLSRPALLGVLVVLTLGWAASSSALVSGALIGKAASTALDARSINEVKTDSEVDARLTATFATQEGNGFASISALVFASRVVLVGFAPTAEIRRRAESIARSEGGFQKFRNLILVGPPKGSMAENMALDARINLALTTAKDVHSVNMRWKVFGGHVFLMGLARTREEADAAVAAVERVDGVKAVHSALEVGKT